MHSTNELLPGIFPPYTVEERLIQLLNAPVEQPELLTTLLPIIIGFIVIELYFGKHKTEELGWNTSVGNAIIWVTTGLSVLITEDLGQGEQFLIYSLILLGVFVGYMNFFHKWSSEIAFTVSSAGIIYSFAYIAVVIAKTDIPVNETVLKASLVFIVGVNIFFKIVKWLEPPSRDDLRF